MLSDIFILLIPPSVQRLLGHVEEGMMHFRPFALLVTLPWAAMAVFAVCYGFM